jgi:lysophospholipase L1-like esterase
VLAVLAVLVAGCGGSSPAKPTTASIVALGDSVPRGTNCSCTPYPPLTADDLTTSSRKLTATNDSVAGYTTDDVLKQIQSESGVIEHLRAADIVEIEVGANDVGYSSACGTQVDCYTPKLPALEKNLAAIVGRVHELRSGHKTLVVLLDYWSVWLGGKYAAAKGEAYVAAAEQMTDDVNAVIRSTAGKTGSAYVDLRAAFKGPDYSYDETHYLSSDGDHPNAAGHEQIAKATDAVIEKGLG